MKLNLLGILFMAVLASGSHVFAATDAVAAVKFSVFNRADTLVHVWQYDDRIEDKECLAAFWTCESKSIVATKRHLIFTDSTGHQAAVATTAFLGKECLIYQEWSSDGATSYALSVRAVGEHEVSLHVCIDGFFRRR